MRFGDLSCSGQVGDGSRQLEELVITPGTQTQLVDSVDQDSFGPGAETTHPDEFPVSEVGIDASLACQLKVARHGDAFTNFAAAC